MADRKTKEIQLSGKLITSDNAAMIGDNFQSLTNLRYTDTHPQGVKGMTKINTTALTNAKIRNGFYFKKDQPAESHVLVQSWNSGETAAYIYDNETAIASQGNFNSTVVLTETSGCSVAKFSHAPGGCVAMCDGKGAYVWGGDEMWPGAFVSYDPDGSFWCDYTDRVRNAITTSAESATIHTVGGGNDSNTVLLLHFENNVTDSGATTHTVTNNGVGFSTSRVKFGTYGANFDPGTDHLTIPDHADFDFSGGTWTVDAWVEPDNLTNNQVIYYQKTDVERIGFTSGSEEPSVGDTIEGATSGETATVQYVQLDDGAWGDGDAEGYIYVHSCSGAFSGENINIDGGTANVLTISGDFADYGDDFIKLYIDTSGQACLLVHECYDGGTDVVSLTTGAVISSGVQYHIEFGENGDTWYIFVDGTLEKTDTDTSRCLNYISTVYVGYDGTNYFDGGMDEYRVSDTCRHTANFTPLATAYDSNAEAYFLIGSTRPIDGFKVYVGTANTTAATMTVYYWNGTAWTAVSSASDGTSASSKTLAQTGSVTFTSTVGSAYPKIENSIMLYWYKVSLSALSSGVTITQASVSAPMQQVKDLWDGIDREIASFKKYTSGSRYDDYTIAVYRDEYDSQNTLTYAQLDSLAASGYLLCGFTERIGGLNISVVPDKANGNTVTMTVYYWDGTAWKEATGLDDGTSLSSKTFAQTGTVTWDDPGEANELKRDIQGEIPLYYYKITVNASLDSETEIFYISGIAAQKTINPFAFPVFAGNSLFLLSESDGYKNMVIRSNYGTADAWSQYDPIYVGGNSAITAGTSIYAQLGADLYEVIVATKANETWMLVPTADGISQFPISLNEGCTAPLTMAVINDSSDNTARNRNMAIWQGADKIYQFNGLSLETISNDIEDVFDEINSSMIDNSAAFYDPDLQEYHWLVATGSSTVLNEEWVYDVKRRKWFKIDRTSDLQCGFQVVDTSGNSYIYGCLNTGYVERLEYGTDFDGNDIVHTLQTGFMLMDKSISQQTLLRRIGMVCAATNTTTNTISVSYYKDGNSTADNSSMTLAPQSSGKTIAYPTYDLGAEGEGVFHCFKYEMTTNDETIGFEPMFAWFEYKPGRSRS